MSNEQMAQSILQFTGGKGNIRIVSNCMTRVRLEVNDLSVVQIDQIKALKGVFGVHVDAQVQVIVGPGTAAKVAACLQELLGDAHKAAGQADKETAQEIAARNKQVIKSRQKVSKGKLFLKTISNVFVPLSSALIASGLLAGIQSILVSLTSTGALESTATVQSIITILRILKAGVLSYLVIHVGVNAAREFKTDINLGGALGAVVLLTGMSADNPLVNIITGEPLKSGQGGVIGVVAAVWVLAKIRKFISKRMPEALDLVLSSFIALTLTGLITLFFIMPVAGLISDGILIFVTKLLEIGGVVTGFVLASIWLPIVMFGLHHFMTPIHIELINQTGMTVLLPILAQAGAGQVGAALAIWLKCRKNKPLVGIVKGGLPSGILGIGEPLIYGVTLPLGKPFLTACLGAGVGGAFIAPFGNVGATSQAVSGILMLPVIADQKWFIYAGGLLLSYAAGFVLTYFFGVPKEAEQPAETLEELEMQ